MKTYYMHTLDDEPATFDGEQICFMGKRARDNMLCRTIQQIRSQQMASKRYRQASGFGDRHEHGYRRVCVPD